MRKFLNKYYLFVYVLLIITLYYLVFVSARGTSLDKISALLVFVSIFIVLTFQVVKVYFSREKGLYRTMLLERPMFNPLGKKDNLRSVFPLYPRFIAVYIDADDTNPYNAQAIDIEAIRYESGYLTDSLFLPIQRKDEILEKNYLSIDEAIKYLKIYTKDFPIIIYNKDFSIQFISKYQDASFIYNAIDILPIAKMIYPEIDKLDVETILDYLKLETDVEDKLYGSRISVAVYLDYLRLNNYNTAVTFAPNDKKYILKPVFPDKETGVINPEKVEESYIEYSKENDSNSKENTEYEDLYSDVKEYETKKSTIFTGIDTNNKSIDSEDDDDDVKVYKK